MEDKTKVYFQKSTGFICHRYPYSYEPENENDFIEISAEEAEPTYQCPYGKIWAVKDGKPVLIDDEQVINTEEYKAEVKANEMATLKQYLSDTDYVISKLNELKLEDEAEYEAERAKYSDVLKKRKEARARINELEG
jgi:hypothetical protein